MYYFHNIFIDSKYLRGEVLLSPGLFFFFKEIHVPLRGGGLLRAIVFHQAEWI